MSTVRSMYLGSFLVSPNNNTFKLNGIQRSLTVGVYYDSLYGLLEALENAARTVLPTISFTLDVDTGKVTVGASSTFTLVWISQDLRDWLGFETHLSGSNTYTAQRSPLFSFFPSLPVARDSGWYHEIYRHEGVSDALDRSAKYVCHLSYRDIQIQYTRSEMEQLRQFLGIANRGVPFAFFPDKTENNNSVNFVIRREGARYEESPTDATLQWLYRHELRCMRYERRDVECNWDFLDILNSSCYNSAVYVRITGIPYIFVQQTPVFWSTPTGYSVVECLALEQGGLRSISSHLDYTTGIVQTSSLDISMMETDDGVLRNLFARQRLGGLETLLAEDVSYTSTAICVKSTLGFPSSGYIFIGPETIKYSGIEGNWFVGCERGMFGSTPVAAKVRDGRNVSFPKVTNFPRVWKGRYLEVYVYARDFLGRPLDAEYFDIGSRKYTICWVGQIYTRPTTRDGIYWNISANTLDCLLDRTIGEGLPRGRLLTRQDVESQILSRYGLSEPILNSSYVGPENTLHTVHLVDNSNNKLCFTIFNKSGEIAKIENAPIIEEYEHDTPPGEITRYAHGCYSWNELKVCVRMSIYYYIAKSDVPMLTFTETDVVVEESGGKCYIGIRLHDTSDVPYTCSFFWDTPGNIGKILGFSGQTTMETSFTHIGVYSNSLIPDYMINANSDKIYFIPAQDTPQWRLQNEYNKIGYAKIGDQEIVKYKKVSKSEDIENVWVLDVEGGRGAFGTAPRDLGCQAGESVEVQMCLGWEDAHWTTIHQELLLSRSGNRTNHCSYDVLTVGGMGIPARLIDSDAFIQLRSNWSVGDTRNLLISGSMKYLDLLKWDLQLSGSFCAARIIRGQSRLSIRQYSEYTPSAYATEINQDSYLLSSMPAYISETAKIVNYIVLKPTYDALRQQHKDICNEYIHDESVVEYGVQNRIEIAHPGLILDWEVAHDIYAGTFVSYFRRFGHDRMMISMGLMPVGLRLNVGDVILVSCSYLPDSAGSEALSLFPFLVVELGQVWVMIGELRLVQIKAVEMEKSEKYKHYNPSAKVVAYVESDPRYEYQPTLQLAANTYSSYTAQFPLSPYVYTPCKDIRWFDRELIGEDFKILIYNDGTDTANERTVVQSDVAQNILVLDSALNFSPNAINTKIRHVEWSKATTKQKIWCYIGKGDKYA